MAMSPLFRPNASVCSLLYLHIIMMTMVTMMMMVTMMPMMMMVTMAMIDEDDDGEYDMYTFWLSGRLQSCHIEYFSGPECNMCLGKH